ENSIFKDDYFQGAQKHVDRMLEPKIGVVDINGEKARRHAEASLELFDRAKVLVERGEREKLPTVAREIADRFAKQAPNVSASPDRRWTPRYADQETLVTSFIQQYGLPEKWSPSTAAEFNRQSRMIQDSLPPEIAPTPPGPKPAQPAAKPKTPNPIPE